jgi:hypothetical protein
MPDAQDTGSTRSSKRAPKGVALEPDDNALNQRLVAIIGSVDAMLGATAAWEASSWKLATLTDEQVEEVVEPAKKMFTRLETMHIEDLKSAVMDALTAGSRISRDALRSAHLIFILLPRYGRLWKQLEFFLAQSAVFRLLQEWHDTYQKLKRYEEQGETTKFLHEAANLATIMDEAVYVSWEEIPELYLQQTDVMEIKAKQYEDGESPDDQSQPQEQSFTSEMPSEMMVDKGIPTWLNRLPQNTPYLPSASSPPASLDSILLPESWNELLVASPTFSRKTSRPRSRPRMYLSSDTLESCPEEAVDLPQLEHGQAQTTVDQSHIMQSLPGSSDSQAIISDKSEPGSPPTRSSAISFTIDEKVQRIVEQLGDDLIKAQNKSSRSPAGSSTVSATKADSTQAWFTVIRHDGMQKDVYCRIVGSRVVARVGGGWQDLNAFLAHWTSTHTLVPVRSITELSVPSHLRHTPPKAVRSSSLSSLPLT